MPECPTCSSSFDSKHGVKVHHKRIHGESIAGVEIKCDWCSDTFRRKPSYAERYENLFCSRECKDAFHSDYLEGRERPEHSELMSEMYSDGNHPMYGVRGEDHPLWQGGGSSQAWRHSRDWYETREIVIERDNNECQICQQSEDLHVHHIQPVSKGGNKFDTENLITLCAEHHYMRHSNGDSK